MRIAVSMFIGFSPCFVWASSLLTLYYMLSDVVAFKVVPSEAKRIGYTANFPPLCEAQAIATQTCIYRTNFSISAFLRALLRRPTLVPKPVTAAMPAE